MLAGVYVYWGVISLAAGWGFLAMLVGWRAVQGEIFATQTETHAQPASPELVPNTSISEVLPDMDANTLLSGIERLPIEEREELIAKIKIK
jgi:hypothetical protein